MSEHTIFVAEDDEDDQFLLKTAFASTGMSCDLVFFTNGEELINQLASSAQRPTLVLLDLNMPIMDGFQTLSHLRAHDAYKTMPVLVLTTSSQREDVTRAYSLGANSFITKPNQYADLTRTVLQLQQFWLMTASIPQHKKAVYPLL
ncbi:response regulator [Fibrella aquatica]|uniref:response regulator n=1 Tax=Fibrella aquatica TaxID=3242487 RepID=UPI0035221EEF